MTILESGNLWLREPMMEENLELKSCAAWLAGFEHPLAMPPEIVLCDGTHPIGGIVTAAILLAPTP